MKITNLIGKSMACASLLVSLSFGNISNVSANDTKNFKEECYEYLPGNGQCASVLPKEIGTAIEKNAEFNQSSSSIMHSGGKAYLILSMGMRNSGGFGIQVKSVKKIRDLAIVQVKEFKPAKNRPVAFVITRPLVVVSVDDPNGALKTVLR